MANHPNPYAMDGNAHDGHASGGGGIGAGALFAMVAAKQRAQKAKKPVIVSLLDSMEFNFVQQLEQNVVVYTLHSALIILSVVAYVAETSPEFAGVEPALWYVAHSPKHRRLDTHFSPPMPSCGGALSARHGSHMVLDVRAGCGLSLSSPSCSPSRLCCGTSGTSKTTRRSGQTPSSGWISCPLRPLWWCSSCARHSRGTQRVVMPGTCGTYGGWRVWCRERSGLRG